MAITNDAEICFTSVARTRIRVQIAPRGRAGVRMSRGGVSIPFEYSDANVRLPCAALEWMRAFGAIMALRKHGPMDMMW